ncbi:MAG TPA: SDR family NAD(P)-dependent oxidoreductase [Coleofasciculaceae cyanobacterium]
MSGIGEGTAYAFAQEGAKVFLCRRRENLGKQVEAKIKVFGGEATYRRADIRREEDVKAFIDGCVQKSRLRERCNENPLPHSPLTTPHSLFSD